MTALEKLHALHESNDRIRKGVAVLSADIAKLQAEFEAVRKRLNRGREIRETYT